jgi:dephospho-CoA kinase
MKLVGVTGGIGMGKSTVAQLMGERGERIIDTDLLARDLVMPGQPALEEIRREFGNEILSPDGTLNRSALAAVVFRDSQKRARLEGILHPRIRAAWLAKAEELSKNGEPRAVVVIPLLFETGAEKEFALTICVACSPGTQARRLRERGWTDTEISNRVESQRPASEKMDRADRVIWNESTVAVCKMQTERILEAI